MAAKLLHALADGRHLLSRAVIIQAVASSREGDAGPGKTVGYRQESDELAAQIIDLGDAKPNIMVGQLGANLFCSAVAPEQGLADEDQNVVADIATTLNQFQQGLGAEGATALGTMGHGFGGDERTGRGEYVLTPGLLHLQPPAAGTNLGFGSEPDNRRTAE